MSASYYESIATNLDQVADDVSEFEMSTVAPCQARLPEVLQGAATSFLAGQADECRADLRAAASILRTAADDARQLAAEISDATAGADVADEAPIVHAL